MQDVYQEVDELMTKLRVGMHKIKPCSRKYAFELPDIPKEADYLKLMYPYDSKYSGLNGSFSHSSQNLHFRAISKARTSQMFLARTQPFSSNLCFGRT